MTAFVAGDVPGAKSTVIQLTKAMAMILWMWAD
jgi:hypothetical protein